MKAKATGRKGKGGYKKDTRCFLSNKAPPISPLTGLALLRVDNGSLICRRCQEGKAYKKGHHRTCPRSKQYDGLAATPKTTKTTRSGGAKPFSDAEKCTRITKPRHNAVIRFVTGLEHQAKARAAKAARLSTAAKVDLPAGFKFQPPAFWEHYDYTMRCSKIFTDVKELRPDNGERFFMQYFHQQQERSKFNVGVVESKRCQCKNCFGGATDAAAAPVGAANAVPGPAPVPMPVPVDLAAAPLQANQFLTAFLCSLAMQGQQMQM